MGKRDKFCSHCGSRTARRFCSPCRTRRIMFGEASCSRVQFMNEGGSWRKAITRWRHKSEDFMDHYWRAVAFATCKCGEILVEELERSKQRKGSFSIISSLSKSEVHRGIVRKLAVGRAALITNNYCPQNRSSVQTMRTWRCMIAHWLRRKGAGNGRSRRCRDTINALTQIVVKIEKEIEPFLEEVERRAQNRASRSKSLKKSKF